MKLHLFLYYLYHYIILEQSSILLSIILKNYINKVLIKKLRQAGIEPATEG